MSSKEEKEQIKQFLKVFFDKDDKIQFYFLKKSKITSELEYKIPFKTKKKLSVKKIRSVQQKILTELNLPWEFSQWSKFIGKTVTESKVYKIPFLNTEDIKLKTIWRVCPIGEHWVRRHSKNLSSGEMTDHDGHCRKNPSNKDLLGADEMDLMSNTEVFLNPKIRTSGNGLGEKLLSLEKQNQYDELISGWTAYWNDVFQLDNPLHPNHVKALIASESMFNPKAKANNPKPIGLARGLMQITEKSARLARDHKYGEYQDHFIDLEYEDLWDPNKNISFGVRHLFRKRETAKWILKREPSWFEVLMDYKGMLKSQSKHAQTARKNLEKYLKALEMDIE
jgi:hypothetical protein